MNPHFFFCTESISDFCGNLNLPDTPYTSKRVLRGVRVEMAKREKIKKIKWERDSHNNQFWTVEFRICSGFVCWVVVMCMLKELG